MVVCIESGILYDVIGGLTTGVTGSYFISIFLLVMLIVGIFLALRMPVEFSAILVLPLLLGLLACDGDWLSITGVTLIYLGILMGKHFFFRS